MIFSLLNQNIQVIQSTTFWLFKTQYIKPFWVFFKKIFFKKYGIFTNNLLKSSLYWIFKSLETHLSEDTTVLTTHVIRWTKHNVKLLQPVQIITMSFHKKMFNTLMFYIFYVLTCNYMSVKSTFELQYTFIFFTSNFYIYMFTNLYYFKIRNF